METLFHFDVSADVAFEVVQKSKSGVLFLDKISKRRM